MKRLNKENKKGFTLIEMMLSIAIIVIIGVLFVPLIVSVKDSFQRVYNMNDAADYAQLYGKAFENALIYDIQNSAIGDFHTYEVSPYMESDPSNSCLFEDNGVDIYNFSSINSMNTVNGGCPKWQVFMDFYIAGDELADGQGYMIHYCVILIDRYKYPDSDPKRKILEYESSVWIPPMMAENLDASAFSVVRVRTSYKYSTTNPSGPFAPGTDVCNALFVYEAL